MAARSGDERAVPSLAERLDRLFRTVRKRDEDTGELREYSLREVADAITAAGTPISFSYIGLLRSGRKDNPDLKRLVAVAQFFGVPVEYFTTTSDRLVRDVDYELDMISGLQELRARRLALRDSVLSQAQEATQTLAEIVARIRELEQGHGEQGRGE